MTHRPQHKQHEAYRAALFSLAALLLVLGMSVLAVGCGDDSSEGPEAAVLKFLTASENKDVDAVLELMDPEIVAAMESDLESQGQTLDDIRELLSDQLFPFDSVKFSDIELESTEIEEGVVLVTVVGGTLTQTIDGVTETLDAEDSDETMEVYAVQIDGKWYLEFE